MYTILGEKVRPYMSGSWFGMYTVMPRGDLHLDRATYIEINEIGMSPYP